MIAQAAAGCKRWLRGMSASLAKLRVQENQLGDVGIEALQLHRIRLITCRMAAAVTQIKSSSQMPVLGGVKIGKESAQQNQMSVSRSAVGCTPCWTSSFSAYDISMNVEFTAVFRKVPEGYIGFVEELPGANTQGNTLEEARRNLHEAVELVLEANRELIVEATRGQSVIREPLKVTA